MRAPTWPPTQQGRLEMWSLLLASGTVSNLELTLWRWLHLEAAPMYDDPRRPPTENR